MYREATTPHPLPKPLAQLIAERFRVLADPTRIRLLDRLRDGAATVRELQDATGGSQQNVSKHLAVLHGAGFVSRAREGNHARYAIADDDVFAMCEQACGGVRRRLAALDGLFDPEVSA